MDKGDVISLKTEESDIFSTSRKENGTGKKQFNVIGKFSREKRKHKGKREIEKFNSH